jgi:hypothetical protein
MIFSADLVEINAVDVDLAATDGSTTDRNSMDLYIYFCLILSYRNSDTNAYSLFI